MQNNILNQDEIDAIIDQRNFNPNTQLSPPPSVKIQNKEPVFSSYKTYQPVQYFNEEAPRQYAEYTYVMKWNYDTRQWEYYSHFGKLVWPNGIPVS